MGVLTEQSRIHAPLAMERTTLSTLPPLYSLPERQQSETQVVISAHVGWEGGGGCGLMGVYIRKGADSTLMTERTKGGGGVCVWRYIGYYCTYCTVKKLRSLNLLFSCVLCIGRKTVHDGAEKIVTLY
jgi:hypothetical protein